MGRRENCLSLVVHASRTGTISFSSNTRYRRTGADRYVIYGALPAGHSRCRRAPVPSFRAAQCAWADESARPITDIPRRARPQFWAGP
jgi:hypothetical protein